MIFIQHPSASPPAAQPRDIDALQSTSAIEEIAVAAALSDEPITLPDSSTDPASSVATPAPDEALRSALYGRYVGQIDARIERAWQRPRTAIGAPLFGCLVRIDQDARGTVLEVTLEQCKGSARWQHSLVSAIESASPLPAPPDPKIFTRVLHLSFQSHPYSPGAPQDAYEPVRTAQLARTGSADENERALAAFGRALREPTSHRVISLTLTGSSTTAVPVRGPPVAVNSSPPPSPLPTRPPAE